MNLRDFDYLQRLMTNAMSDTEKYLQERSQSKIKILSF